ncbi:MAG: hypothetical protein Q9168_006014, partial [Polycauliona sp. 1 TL-2023]
MTFKSLLKTLNLSNNIFGTLEPVHIESLILRFAGDMQFGRNKQRIANEAVRIVQRMSRDWLTEGRRPGGICGAALILAARMNNLRRAVKEVVYIVRVAEMTITKRLEEFKATESSGLTVEQFRTIDLPGAADPPSFQKNQKKDKTKDKKKRKRKVEARVSKSKRHKPSVGDEVEVDGDAASKQPDSTTPLRRSTRGQKRKAPIEIEDNGSTDDGSESAESVAPSDTNAQLQTPAATQAQRDRQSMPPPRAPIDPALLHVSSQRLADLQAGSSPDAGPARGRGRPPGKTQPPVKPSAREIQVEEELEAEIHEILHAHGDGETSGAVPPTTSTPPSTEPDGSPTSATPKSSLAETKSKSRKRVPRRDNSAESRNSSNLRDASPAGSSQSSASSHSRSSRSSSRSQSPPAKARPGPRPIQRITSTSTTQPLLDLIPSSEVIPDDEFADDLDVANCLLSSHESTIKERLWVNANSEYLRALQAKVLKQQLAEQNGTARKVVKRKKRRTRMGDLSGVYDERGPPKDAGEAVERMMKKRAFSKKINYQQIQD